MGGVGGLVGGCMFVFVFYLCCVLCCCVDIFGNTDTNQILTINAPHKLRCILMVTVTLDSRCIFPPDNHHFRPPRSSLVPWGGGRMHADPPTPVKRAPASRLLDAAGRPAPTRKPRSNPRRPLAAAAIQNRPLYNSERSPVGIAPSPQSPRWGVRRAEMLLQFGKNHPI